jgi:hypothetical protein
MACWKADRKAGLLLKEKWWLVFWLEWQLGP